MFKHPLPGTLWYCTALTTIHYSILKSTVSAGNWDKLPPKEKQEKERFLSGEQRASKGFMTQANTQMELLYNMSEAEPVARCLCDLSLAKRTAAAVSNADLYRRLVFNCEYLFIANCDYFLCSQ